MGYPRTRMGAATVAVALAATVLVLPRPVSAEGHAREKNLTTLWKAVRAAYYRKAWHSGSCLSREHDVGLILIAVERPVWKNGKLTYSKVRKAKLKTPYAVIDQKSINCTGVRQRRQIKIARSTIDSESWFTENETGWGAFRSVKLGGTGEHGPGVGLSYEGKFTSSNTTRTSKEIEYERKWSLGGSDVAEEVGFSAPPHSIKRQQVLVWTTNTDARYEMKTTLTDAVFVALPYPKQYGSRQCFYEAFPRLGLMFQYKGANAYPPFIDWGQYIYEGRRGPLPQSVRNAAVRIRLSRLNIPEVERTATIRGRYKAQAGLDWKVKDASHDLTGAEREELCGDQGGVNEREAIRVVDKIHSRLNRMEKVIK